MFESFDETSTGRSRLQVATLVLALLAVAISGASFFLLASDRAALQADLAVMEKQVDALSADNESVVVTRNENYWRPGRPYLDGIEFAIIPEAATALRSVIAGEKDMAFSLPARLKPVIDRSKTLQVVTAPTLYCIQLYINYARAPLNNVKVRQALNFGIDRDAFVKATMGGLGEAATMTLPSSHWAYDKSVSTLYPHDPAKARKLRSGKR